MSPRIRTRPGYARRVRNDSAYSTLGRPARSQIYAQLEEQGAELRKMGGLPTPVEAEGIWDDIWAAETHHSTAIEGNTLILREVDVLLRENRPIGGKEWVQYQEVKGFGAAARWVYEQGHHGRHQPEMPLVSLADVRHLHHLAMAMVWLETPRGSEDEGPGSFRRHNINPFGGGMHPPDWTDVHAQMTDWVVAVNGLRCDTRPVPEVIADLHAAFERIHPFIDGNGRAGRLLTNLIFVRLGYPPAIILKQDRNRYLSALRRADTGDFGPLGEMLARQVLLNLYRFVIPAIAGPSKLVPLAALVTKQVSHRALRNAAARGRLRAVRATDGTWRSSRRWVDAYVAERYQRG